MHSLLVLGGARSGKSRYAQQRAEASGLAPVFLATATASDAEMRQRILRHQQDRGPEWQTMEVPLDLGGAIRQHGQPGRVLLVDCLTLWLSNLLLAELDTGAATDKLAAAIGEARCPVILVGNEVGSGIVPEHALARRFRDDAGRTNQRIAATVDEVQLLVAGLPLRLKP